MSKLGFIKKSVSSIFGYGQIKETNSMIADMGKKILSPKYQLEKSRIETFDEALKRLGVSYQDALGNHRNFVIVFYVSLIFSSICFTLAVDYMSSGNYLGLASTIAIMLVCLANCMKHSFRAYQIKVRRLCSFEEFGKGGVKNFFPWFIK